MVEVLSSAKRQSVKEIKKNAKHKRIKKLITKWSLIVIIIIVLVFLIKSFLIQNNNSFIDQSTGIKFSSKDFYVVDVFEILAADNNFFIVFNINPGDINNLSTITDQIIFLQSTLSAKNKNNTLIINIMDDQRRTISCQSNLGDLYTNQELTKDECTNLLKSDTTSIIVDFPDPSLEESNVYSSVGEKYIYIKPKSLDDLNKSVLLSLSMMFDDIASIKKRVDVIKQNIDTNFI
jgi:hypothetical protein